MLTKKELLKYRKQKGKIIPVFIDPNNNSLIEFVDSLNEVFEHSIGKTRKQIEEEADELIAAFDIEKTIAQGFKKLSFDLLTFESLLSSDIVEFRDKVFKCAFETLNTCCSIHTKIDDYRNNVIAKLNHNMVENSSHSSAFVAENSLESCLYSDLPEFHKVTERKALTTSQLLNKYNVSLVQGLLFHCSKIKIILPSVSNCKAQFRQLLKHIKFFQLVAYFNKQEDTVEIEIDGPLSLFTQTHKYGFNLACFFPALLLMPQWELCAFIEMGKEVSKCGELNLNHKMGLLSHYKNYSAYIPEEFQLFIESFLKQSNETWKLNENCDQVLFDGDNFFFPDFEFTSKKGTIVYLELFHPWHSSAIKHRLHALAKKPLPFNLILGTAKSLLKNEEIASILENSSFFKQFSFIFKEVLLPANILKLLNIFES